MNIHCLKCVAKEASRAGRKLEVRNFKLRERHTPRLMLVPLHISVYLDIVNSSKSYLIVPLSLLKQSQLDQVHSQCLLFEWKITGSNSPTPTFFFFNLKNFFIYIFLTF